MAAWATALAADGRALPSDSREGISPRSVGRPSSSSGGGGAVARGHGHRPPADEARPSASYSQGRRAQAEVDVAVRQAPQAIGGGVLGRIGGWLSDGAEQLGGAVLVALSAPVRGVSAARRRLARALDERLGGSMEQHGPILGAGAALLLVNKLVVRQQNRALIRSPREIEAARLARQEAAAIEKALAKKLGVGQVERVKGATAYKGSSTVQGRLAARSDAAVARARATGRKAGKQARLPELSVIETAGGKMVSAEKALAVREDEKRRAQVAPAAKTAVTAAVQKQAPSEQRPEKTAGKKVGKGGTGPRVPVFG